MIRCTGGQTLRSLPFLAGFPTTIAPPGLLYSMTKYTCTGLFFFPIGTGPHRKPSLGLQSDLFVTGMRPADWAAGPEVGRVAAWLASGVPDGAYMVRGVGGETQTRGALQESRRLVDGASVGKERTCTDSQGVQRQAVSVPPRSGCQTGPSHSYLAPTHYPRAEKRQRQAYAKGQLGKPPALELLRTTEWFSGSEVVSIMSAGHI